LSLYIADFEVSTSSDHEAIAAVTVSDVYARMSVSNDCSCAGATEA